MVLKLFEDNMREKTETERGKKYLTERKNLMARMFR